MGTAKKTPANNAAAAPWGNHMAKADSGGCPCGNGQGFWTCKNCDSFTQQPQIQQVALTENCFWSYPVQCN